MSDLRELYQEMILDHNKNPRNFKELPSASHRAEGYNPLCGDHYTIYVDVKDGVIHDLGFQGSGCAISKASASVMTQTVKGKSPEDADAIFQKYRGMITGEVKPEIETMGKLAAFSGVSEFPTRVKCALLAWHALSSALRGEQETSTE